MIRRFRRRILVLGGASMTVILAAFAGSRPGLGQEPAAPAPQPIDAADLLRSEPFDRLTLIDNTVLIVEPVSPRPLPVIDPKKERERRRQAGSNSTATFIEIGGAKTKKGEEPAKEEDTEALETVRTPPPPGEPQRGPRLRGEAVQHQEDSSTSKTFCLKRSTA